MISFLHIFSFIQIWTVSKLPFMFRKYVCLNWEMRNITPSTEKLVRNSNILLFRICSKLGKCGECKSYTCIFPLPSLVQFLFPGGIYIFLPQNYSLSYLQVSCFEIPIHFNSTECILIRHPRSDQRSSNHPPFPLTRICPNPLSFKKRRNPIYFSAQLKYGNMKSSHRALRLNMENGWA